MKGPSNVLSVKNVSDYHLTCKTICGYIVEKDPSSVLSVINVSPGNRHCFITKENTILIHRTNVNHVVNLSLMTMLWRGTIARNDLLETRKDSPAGCVMNTAMIIVDIFITCINKCKDKWSYKRCLYREPQKINNSTLPGNAWGAFGKWLMSSGANAAGSRVTVLNRFNCSQLFLFQRFQFIRAVLHTFVAE